jgi:Adenosylmethionine-8-amino-7-oxononanoate aminotransferase
VHRACELEGPFEARLSELESHPLVREVRGGVGLMAAVALAPELLADDADAASRFERLVREAGLLVRGLSDGVALAPPLVVEDEHVELAVAALATALDALDR